jgi:hypothetical protein
VTLAASIVRNPAVTREERHRQRRLLELLLDTGEDYQREVEIDRELYQVIALDARVFHKAASQRAMQRTYW